MIVATAGHVDHGKTSLIKQLTGVDTDRLEEEKRRGLSINLGFAYPAKGALGFIDVPGHQRFINSMIAGVSSIDLGMLVVAADDGPMPQTIEHLDVMSLLGIKSLLIVISKIDKADDTQINKVREAVLALLPKELAASCHIFEVSNITNDGILALQQHIEQRALDHHSRSTDGFFRLSIDRVFLLKGAGLVVTGTVTAGEISVGDNVHFLPKGITLRVRSIHAQDEPAEKGQNGQRCALNLVGDIEKDDVQRGDWLLGDGAGAPTERFAARCSLLPSAPVSLKHMSPLKLYIGAKHIAVKIFLLERESGSTSLTPGEDCLVQIISSEPVCCWRGERFLLRDDSESFTLGGGIVLDPQAQRVRKLRPEAKAFLKAMEMPNLAQALDYLILQQQQIINLTSFAQSWNLRNKEAMEQLKEAGITEHLYFLDSKQHCLAISQKQYLQLQRKLIEQVKHWHTTHPELAGIKSSELEKLFNDNRTVNIFQPLLSGLLEQGKLGLSGGLLTAPNFTAEISSEDQKRWLSIKEILESRGIKIPLLSEISTESGLNMAQILEAVRSAKKSGQLYKVSEKRVGLAKTLLALALEVQNLAQQTNEFSAVDYKNKLGIGRNYAIELLEYFDSIGFTQRRGSGRIVLNKKRPEDLFN